MRNGHKRDLHLPTITALPRHRPVRQTTMAPLLRPQTALRATHSLIRTSPPSPLISLLVPTATSTTPARTISSTPTAREADSHDSHYNPPSGWLWGVPPGQKYQKEGWEGIWNWGFYGSLGLAVVAYAYKPDTRYVYTLFTLEGVRNWSGRVHRRVLRDLGGGWFGRKGQG